MSSVNPLKYYPGMATKSCRAEINEPFAMWRGGTLPHLELAYETWGKLNSDNSNGVLIFSGLSPSAHAASSGKDPSPGWWEYMIGPGKPIDTDRYYVIAMNSLGSCFGSTGPASINPKTAQAYRMAFPALSIEDIANAGHLLLQHLGISQLHSVIGASMGGMTALAFSVLHPEATRRLVSISAAANSSPFAIAIRSLQRDMIRHDPQWRDGDYDFDKQPRQGMRQARKLGITSYRSPAEWQHRFGRKRIHEAEPCFDFRPEFEIESYLEYNADKFADHFDANCYLYLSRAMDWFDVADHGGSVEAGLEKMRTEKNLVIGVQSDFLFPPWQQKEIADALDYHGRQVEYVNLPSVQGHDAFLVDVDGFAPLLAAFLRD